MIYFLSPLFIFFFSFDMCGIAGLIGRNSPKSAKALLDKINHRGPDGSGYWITGE